MSYTLQDPGIDDDAFAALERRVAKWRNSGMLKPPQRSQTPKFSPSAQGIPSSTPSPQRWDDDQVDAFNNRFNAAGPRVISGKDQYAGAVYQHGEARGLTEEQFSQKLQGDIGARGKRAAEIMRDGDTLPNGKPKTAARKLADQRYQSFYQEHANPRPSRPAREDYSADYKKRSRRFRMN